MKNNAFSRGLLCAVLAVVAPAGVAHAQGTAAGAKQYPTKTIRFVIPFSAGGFSDILGRLVGQKLSESVGQPVIMDNRAGASGNIGAELVARRPLTVEQVPRALARGCDPVAGCKRRT